MDRTRPPPIRPLSFSLPPPLPLTPSPKKTKQKYQSIQSQWRQRLHVVKHDKHRCLRLICRHMKCKMKQRLCWPQRGRWRCHQLHLIPSSLLIPHQFQLEEPHHRLRGIHRRIHHGIHRAQLSELVDFGVCQMHQRHRHRLADFQFNFTGRVSWLHFILFSLSFYSINVIHIFSYFIRP